ncbi:hypothetical protein ACLBXI_07225 [Bacillus cereus]
MQEQKYLVIHHNGVGSADVYEFETKGGAREQVTQLIENVERPGSIRITKEIPVDIKVKVDVEF